jgi:hypothetical protein
MTKTYQLVVELYQQSLQDGKPENRCHLCGATLDAGLQGCFGLFNQVKLREHSVPAYGAVNLLTTDAYTLQHGELFGHHSNASHLIRLCWLVERGGDPFLGSSPKWWQVYLKEHEKLPQLSAPASRGEITITDIVTAHDAQEHSLRVNQWAESVWQAWHEHQAWACAELDQIFANRK